MGWVSGWWGCGCTGRRDATGIQTQCADQGIASDFMVLPAMVGLCYHRGVGNSGLVKDQGKRFTDC